MMMIKGEKYIEANYQSSKACIYSSHLILGFIISVSKVKYVGENGHR